MKQLKLFVAAWALVGFPVLAQPSESPAEINASNMTDAELFAALDDREKPWYSNSCSIGVPVFSELDRRMPDPARFKHGLVYSEALCASERDDYELGARKVAELEKIAPDADYTDLALYFEGKTGNAQAVLDRFRSLSDAQLAELGRDRFWASVRMLREKGRIEQFEDQALQWFSDGKLAVFPSELEGGIVSNALDAAVRQEKLEQVDGLLRLIRDPRSYIDLLANRKYELIWPRIEERAGPNLKPISEEYSFWAEARLENNESDRDRFSDAAHGLYFEGRYEDAIALAQKWRERNGTLKNIEEGDGWALNIQAYAYDAIGQRAKADAVFDDLAGLDPDANPWVVSFVINRASRLIGHDRWEDGLAANALAGQVAGNYGSQFAKMIIARNNVCALQNLGRADEIDGDLEFLRNNWEVSQSLAAQALQCAGQNEEAARVLQSALADDRYRETAIGALQPKKFELFYTPSNLPQNEELLSQFPELRADLVRYGRVIPDEFTPIAFLSRKNASQIR
ncbi:hypothetical protein [Pontixanthobacter luteolus]|uniref:hypothetical protein n=1 Tax=Pontixanthobacter luteolus TaxID=295089 RepID=UPI0023022491|nr:hypothetical protein [Pontixanthobacter luteolus]